MYRPSADAATHLIEWLWGVGMAVALKFSQMRSCRSRLMLMKRSPNTGGFNGLALNYFCCELIILLASAFIYKVELAVSGLDILRVDNLRPLIIDH